MANLIITIISIGLVAVAAIMGAYYGGTAFIQGQSKAFANTIVAQGDQISAAWSVYSAQNGGNWSGISDVSTLSSAPDGQSYLASIPIPPPQVANTSAAAGWVSLSTPSTGPIEGQWHMGVLTDIATAPTTATSQNGVYFRLQDDNNGVNTCQYVAQIAGGSSANATMISTATGLQTASTTRKFDCVFYDTAGAASLPTTSMPKYVYYRTY